MSRNSEDLPVRKVDLRDYLALAPSALALERVLEWRIYSGLTFRRPVLDIGCGEGLFAHVVFGARVDTGIDPNSRELERAAELGAYDELVNCRGDQVPKPDNFYQTVFSNSVLEHIPELSPVVKEVYRVLAPGGMFYLTVPSHRFEEFTWPSRLLGALRMDGLARRYQCFFNGFWRHFNVQDLPRWRALLETHGFQVESAQYYGSRRSCLLNDALAPFGGVGLVMKKLTNKWTLWPSVRRVYLTPLIPLYRRLNQDAVNVKEGGLVFIAARKRVI